MSARVIRKAAAAIAAVAALSGAGFAVTAGHNTTAVAAGCMSADAVKAVGIVATVSVSDIANTVVNTTCV